VKPSHELLGEVLLGIGRPAEATLDSFWKGRPGAGAR
jgi:hypothetical protein